MALRELIASFSIDTGQAQTALKGLNSGIQAGVQALGGLAAAFVGSALVKGMGGFIAHQIEAGSRVNDLSERLGVGTDELQKFQLAAGLAGLDAEGAAQALGFLNKNMGEAINGNKEAAQTFEKLGIDLKDGEGNVRELGDVIPELADAFEGLSSNQERTALAMKVFGKSGAALIPLLKEGSDELLKTYERFEQLGGGMSGDFVKAADKAGDQIDLLKFGLTSWKSKIALEVLPMITRMVVRFQDWTIMLHKVTDQTNLAKAVWLAFGAGSAAASIKAASGFAKMLGILPKDAGFWKTVLGLGQIALVAALAAGLFLIFEDLFTFLQGGDSVIGDVMTKFLGAEEAANFAATLRDVWAQIQQTVTDLGPPLGDLGKMLLEMGVTALPYIVAGFEFVVRLVASAVSLVATLVQSLAAVGSAVTQLVHGSNAGIDGLGGKLGKIIDQGGDRIFGANGLFGSGPSKVTDYGVPSANVGATIRQPASFERGGGQVTVNQTNNVTNEIQGVKDAQGAGVAAKNGTRNALDGSLDSALANYGSG